MSSQEIKKIIKRDYSTAPFVLEKITNAIANAMAALGHGSEQDAKLISMQVYESLLNNKEQESEYIPTIEQVQDMVEDKLMSSEFHDVAKAYIIYRNKRALERKTNIFEKRHRSRGRCVHEVHEKKKKKLKIFKINIIL